MRRLVNSRRGVLGAVGLALAVFAGCRTNKDILVDYARAMSAGDYRAAVTAEVGEKAEEGGVDELMWRLMSGYSLFLQNAEASGVGQFDKAEDVFLRNEQTSVFRQGATGAFAMISNDRAFPYAGAGSDRVFACFYKAVEYARTGHPEATRTELNRAAQHQDNWLEERKREIADAEEKLREDADGYAKKEGGAASRGADQGKASETVEKALANEDFMGQIREKCGFDITRDGNLAELSRKDWVNRYVEYATGVFRWIAGDGDGANFLRELTKMDPDNMMIWEDFKAMSGGVKPRNLVWVFVEDGMGPWREEWRIDLPTVIIPYLNRYVMYAGMAFPYLEYGAAAHGAYELLVDDKPQALVEIQDVDRLLKTEFDVYFRGAITREIIRTVVKIGAQVALGVCAEHANNNYVRHSLIAAQAGVAVWAASVTQADLRSWVGLPKKVYAMRTLRPTSGRIVLTGDRSPVAEVTVPEGNTMIFVRKPSSSAPAVVKTFTLQN